MFVTKAHFPVMRFQVLMDLSFPTDRASFPDGWTLTSYTPALKYRWIICKNNCAKECFYASSGFYISAHIQSKKWKTKSLLHTLQLSSYVLEHLTCVLWVFWDSPNCRFSRWQCFHLHWRSSCELYHGKPVMTMTLTTTRENNNVDFQSSNSKNKRTQESSRYIWKRYYDLFNLIYWGKIILRE